jgi:hypothetical protein
MVMKISIFWDITPYSPLKINWRFGETNRIHLQGGGISQARYQRVSRWQAEQIRTTEPYTCPEDRPLQDTDRAKFRIRSKVLSFCTRKWTFWFHKSAEFLDQPNIYYVPVAWRRHSAQNCRREAFAPYEWNHLLLQRRSVELVNTRAATGASSPAS